MQAAPVLALRASNTVQIRKSHCKKTSEMVGSSILSPPRLPTFQTTLTSNRHVSVACLRSECASPALLLVALRATKGSGASLGTSAFQALPKRLDVAFATVEIEEP